MKVKKMSERKNRSQTADIVKGMAIINVVFYHLVHREKDGLVDLAIRESIYLAIPLFFLISGYFYSYKKRTVKDSIKHRIKNLLLPAVISMAVLLLIGLVYFHFVYKYTFDKWLGDVLFTYLRPEFVQHFTMKWGDGGQLFFNLSPVWFIWTMFFSALVFFPAAEIAFKSFIHYIVTFLVLFATGSALYLLFPPMPWSITLAPMYAAIMLLGAGLRHVDLLENRIFPAWFRAIATLGCIVLHVSIFRFCGTDAIYTGNIGSHGILGCALFIVETVLGGYAMFNIADLFDQAGIVGISFGWIGMHSFDIMIFHCFFGGIVADLLWATNKPGPAWYQEMTPAVLTTSIISFVMGLVLSMAVCALKDSRKAMKRNEEDIPEDIEMDYDWESEG
jgi:fucose 4-O-acetylase-like acetyltransferase